MKKTILITLMMLTIYIASFSQSSKETVYLKNGSVITGTIIEEIPDSTIKIKTNDNNIFIFKINEIKRITKEEIITKNKHENNEPKGYIGLLFGLAKPTIYDWESEDIGTPSLGLYVNIKLGYLFTKNIGFSLAYINTNNNFHYESNINNNYSTNTLTSNSLIPGIILRFKLKEKLYLDLNPSLGYSSIKMDGSYTSNEESKSLSYNIGVGLRYQMFNRIDLMLNSELFSYTSKYTQMYKSSSTGKYLTFNKEKEMSFPLINLGISYKLW